MKICVVQKCPSTSNYAKLLGLDIGEVFNLSSQKVPRLLKRDIDISGFSPSDWDWVILVGSEAVKEYSKYTAVSDHTGRVVEGKKGETNLIACISPAMLSFKPELAPVFEATKTNIQKIVQGKVAGTVKADIRPITDYNEALEYVRWLRANATIFALDSETTDLDMRNGEILGISLSHKVHQGVYIHVDCIVDEVSYLIQCCIEEVPVVLHNAKFDMKWFKYHFGWDFDIAKQVHDTMIQHYLLDERQGTHGLKSLTLKYGTLGDYDKGLEEFKENYCKSYGIKKDDFSYGLIPWDVMWPYACLTHDSKVLMANGEKRDIGDLCRKKSSEEVLSYNEKTGQIEAKPITGWHKNTHKSKEWFKLKFNLQTKELQNDMNGIPRGPAFTSDHRVYTQRGYVQVKDLVPGNDRILTTERLYTKDTYQIIYGSLMGDGSLQSKNGAGAGVLMSQAEKRAGYLKFKASALNCLDKITVKGDTRASNRTPIHSFVTGYNHQLTDLYHELPTIETTSVYKPVPTPEFLQGLDKRALAIWYFDDGNLPSQDGKPRIWSRTIANNPTYVINVLNWLKTLGYDAHIHNDGIDNQFFVIDSEDDFFSDMLLYVPTECVKYKIPEKYWAGSTQPYKWDLGESEEFYFAKIMDIVAWYPSDSRRGYSTKWCIDVADNSNFFTVAGLVHNCLDTASTLELHFKFLPLIENNPKLRSCYYELMIPALMFLTRMEYRGIPISVPRLKAARKFLEEHLTSAKQKLYEHPDVKRFSEDKGALFNPNSPLQIRSLLFDYVGLDPTGKLTGTGAISTDAEVLQELANQHDVPKFILEARKYGKLINTYIDKLIPVVAKDSKVRTGFNLTSTTSGRLSSSGAFNVQQLPRDNPIIKGCVKARPGYKIVACDLTTAEVYYAAVLSGDKGMQQVFINMKDEPEKYPDFHSNIAHMVFHLQCEPAEVKKLHPALRQGAKAITFGILYGSGPAKVAESVNEALMEQGLSPTCTIEEAKGYISTYFGRFPRLKRWIDECHNEIKTNGFIYNHFGRKRRLHNIRSTDRGVVAGEVRSGFNAIIQSVSSDHLLMGAMEADLEIMRKNLDANIFALVHDSVVAEVREDQVYEYLDILYKCIQKDRGCSIPGYPIGVDQDTEEGGSTDYSGKKLAKVYPELSEI